MRHFGNRFVGGQVGLEQPLSPRLAVLAGAAAEYRDYDGADPLFLGGRRDLQLDASVGLRAILARGFSARPRVTLSRNASNFDLYDFRRVTVSIGPRAEF